MPKPGQFAPSSDAPGRYHGGDELRFYSSLNEESVKTLFLTSGLREREPAFVRRAGLTSTRSGGWRRLAVLLQAVQGAPHVDACRVGHEVHQPALACRFEHGLLAFDDGFIFHEGG